MNFETETPEAVEPNETNETKETPPVEPRTASDDTLDQMWNIELVIRDKEAVLEELKEETREVKKSLEESVIELRRLLQSSHEDQPLFESKPNNKPDEKDLNESKGEKAGWESESIKVLLKPSLPGMGAKKIDSLIDEVPTLGDFEKLRSQVGRDADHLSKLLPKGFGEKLTDDLENRQLEFIANFQPVDSVAGAGVIDDVPDSPEQDENLTEEEQQLLSRLNQLATDESGDWMDVRKDPEVWGSGFEAGNAGEEIGECIYTASDNQDDWLRGWASANSEWTEIYDEGDVDVDGIENEVVATEQPVEESEGSSPDVEEDELANL